MGYANWVTAIATLFLGFVAIFQDRLRARVMRPKLDIEIETKPPHCHMTKAPIIKEEKNMGDSKIDYANMLYIRAFVTNSGNSAAKDVELFIKELKRNRDDIKIKPESSFLPMNLKWSHIHTMYFPSIAPDMYKHCDVGHIIEPKKRSSFEYEDNTWEGFDSDWPILSFDTIVKPNTLSHLVPPGVYEITLVAAGSNCKPIKRKFELKLLPVWWNDQSTELESGIEINRIV